MPPETSLPFCETGGFKKWVHAECLVRALNLRAIVTAIAISTASPGHLPFELSASRHMQLQTKWGQSRLLGEAQVCYRKDYSLYRSPHYWVDRALDTELVLFRGGTRPGFATGHSLYSLLLPLPLGLLPASPKCPPKPHSQRKTKYLEEAQLRSERDTGFSVGTAARELCRLPLPCHTTAITAPASRWAVSAAGKHLI